METIEEMLQVDLDLEKDRPCFRMIDLRNRDLQYYVLEKDLSKFTHINLTNCVNVQGLVDRLKDSGLEELNLANTDVVTVPYMRVERLVLSRCQSLDIDSCDFSGVMRLDLSYTTVDHVPLYKNLYEVSLVGCELEDFSTLGWVRVLDLRNTNITGEIIEEHLKRVRSLLRF
jgi:uncharacterized protein YjbI with pentapeptide repeats